MSERSLTPTSRKRKEARQEGRVAVSGLLVGAMIWIGVAAALSGFGRAVVRSAVDVVAQFWSTPSTLNPETAFESANETSLLAAIVIAAFAMAVFVVAFLARYAQVGFVWAPSRIGGGIQAPLGQRFSQLFSWDKLVVALRGVAVFAVFGSLLGGILWYEKETIARQLFDRSGTFATMDWLASWGLLFGGCLFAIGLLDYAYQRYRFEQSLHMTPEEMRAEVQAVQANPQIGAGRQRLQQDFHSTRDGESTRRTS